MSAVRVRGCRPSDWLRAWSDSCRSASHRIIGLAMSVRCEGSGVPLVSYSRGLEEDGELKAVPLLREAIPVSCVLIVVIG